MTEQLNKDNNNKKQSLLGPLQYHGHPTGSLLAPPGPWRGVACKVGSCVF